MRTSYANHQRASRGQTIWKRAAMAVAAVGLAGLTTAGLAQGQGAVGWAPTANTAGKPPADTPVPAHFQESYRVYLEMKAAADAKGGGSAELPDWSGLWSRDPSAGLKFDPAQEGTGFGAPLGPTTAKLTPRYQAAFEQKLREVAAGNEWDQLSDCLPSGFPRFLTEPFLREFIVTPGETWWINEQQSEARRIYTDDRGHIPEEAAQPLWVGDSIGFWDGQTLVVHTIRVVHGQYQRSQPDYSSQISTIERIRMVDQDTIEDEVTVWDPKGLREPWHVVQKYVRVKNPGARIDMWSCNANNNVIRTPTGGSQFILPGESVTITQTYKDPNTFFLTDTQKELFAEDESEEGE